MLALACFAGLLALARAGPATEASYKGQFCTDPRTMRKHAAYTEWADAYSCTRHRCQPGGRNLAIYTVGCKRVEAPESAIECEEVVEDTNMQFPYCCTRLRCLVVVRGEVWTRVLGQPWETLPAAPWSHMYKMKKPPPADGTFLPSKGEGPIYELQTESDSEQEKLMRSKKSSTESPDCNDAAVARAAPPAPDIVIALSTNSDKEAPRQKLDNSRYFPPESRHKRGRKQSLGQGAHDVFDEDTGLEPRVEDQEETVTEKEKVVNEDYNKLEPASEERGGYFANAFGVTQKPMPKVQPHHQVAWTEIPQAQWNDHESPMEPEAVAAQLPRVRHQPEPVEFEPHQAFHQPEFPPMEAVKKEEKPGNLQALVDAIGTRMRDIESVVQRMSEKVHQAKPATPEAEFASGEKGPSFRAQDNESEKQHHEDDHLKEGAIKRPAPDSEHYKRFNLGEHGSKYLHGTGEVTTEQPLFVEDTNLNGYFSDGSNAVRRSPPKEPAATYMAPVENRRKATHSASEELEKKHKKRSHKKKKAKGHHKKHHQKDDKRKRFNRVNSVELDRNAVSMEDSSSLTNKPE